MIYFNKFMSIFNGLLIKLGLKSYKVDRSSISIFVLDDDHRRHRWFKKRFAGDDLDLAETPAEAKELLSKYAYDAIFLDHDLLPEHYEMKELEDYSLTGYEVAHWLFENKELQRAATVIVHTRNADAAIRMVEILRESGRQVEYVPFPMLDVKIKNYWKR
jgi:CheY-like chemotaxis protein